MHSRIFLYVLRPRSLSPFCFFFYSFVVFFCFFVLSFGAQWEPLPTFSRSPSYLLHQALSRGRRGSSSVCGCIVPVSAGALWEIDELPNDPAATSTATLLQVMSLYSFLSTP